MMRIIHLFKNLFINYNMPNAYITVKNTETPAILDHTRRKHLEIGYNKNIKLQNGRIKKQIRGKGNSTKKKDQDTKILPMEEC